MAIEIKNINKKYGDKIILDDISLTLEQGKVTSFIGPNGAGKSTILSIISRLISADKGQIFLDNQNIHQLKNQEIAKKLSILKQSNHIELKLTIEELVAFGRFPYSQGNLSKIDYQFIDEAICYMDLNEIRNMYLDELSGGQRQRAYIAMVLAQDTDYILLDEPLNNLDMYHSVQIMQTLYRLSREKHKAIAVVIHDINFASVYSDYIYAIKNANIIHSGPTQQIMQEDVLKNIFDFHIPVHKINQQSLGLYFLTE